MEYGLFVKHCKVEVYLLELKLCEHSDPNNVLSCHFSKADTIGERAGRRRGRGEGASSDVSPGCLGLWLLSWLGAAPRTVTGGS